MGTRALTFVYEGDEPIINMYRQYDGYPEGHGADLALFLSRGRLVNGLSGKETTVFNGMGCLAAQLVANFKEGPGQFYLYPTSAKDCGQDYEYHIYERDREVRVRIQNRGFNMFGLTMDDTNEALFDGNCTEFYNFCVKAEVDNETV
jgi:hypothetical protein